MRNRPDGAAAKNRVFRGFAATDGTNFELIRYNSVVTWKKIVLLICAEHI